MADNRPDAGSGESRRLAPSWTVALFALVALSPAFDLYEAGRVSLVWFGIGVVSWAAATGPVAASRFGRRVGAWFRGIGALGRAIVILGVAGAWTGVVVTFEPPAVPIDSFVLGGLCGGVATILRRRRRRPDRLTPRGRRSPRGRERPPARARASRGVRA